MSALKGNTNIINILKGSTGVAKVLKGSSLYYSSGLPLGYQRIGFIRSSGTQFINSGIIADLETKVEVKFRYTSVPTITSIIVGTHGTSTANNAFIFGCASSGKLYSRIDNKSTATSDINADTDWHVAVIDKTGAKLDGEQLVSFDSPTSFESAYPIYLFCSKDSNGQIQYRASADIDYVKIWKNGVLVFNGESAIEIATGDLGIYDKVSETLLENSGTEDFSRGAIIVNGFKECEYAQCEPTGATGDGNGPYITTRFIPKDSLGYSVTLAVTYSASDKTRLGCRNDDDDTRFWSGFASGKLYWGFNVVLPTNSAERPAITTSTFYNVKTNFLNDRRIKLDNVEYHTSGSSYELPTLNKSGEWTQPFVIFGSNNKGTITSRESKVKEVLFTDNSDIVGWLVPMYRTSDNEVGLYDIVSREFLTNDGTGSLVKGSDV